jgi:Phytanoyl-CoA dioxygenase (PhyH)
MTTVDLRSRLDDDVAPIDFDDFIDNRLPLLVDANGDVAGRNTVGPTLAPLTLDVEGELLTLQMDDDRVTVRRGGADVLVVALDRIGFSELVEDVASMFGLHMTGRAELRRGSLDDFVEWEPMLRRVIDGRPLYERGSISFVDRRGAPLNLSQSFSLDDDPGELGHFLAQAGFLHLQDVFSESEMSAVSDELDVAIEAAEPNDGASWWAKTDAGELYPSRILGFNQKSQTLRELLQSERFAAIGTLTGDQFVQRDPDVGDSAEGLLKKVGVTEGISDVSWHKDCAMGGHSRSCCGLTIGISVTGATRENGELGVVPGSHRANIAALGTEGLDLPRLPLPTKAGDVTVHCSCTLHMSRPPVSGERRVVYSGFSLAPRPGDRRRNSDPSEARRQRALLNDQTHALRNEVSRMSSFEL